MPGHILALVTRPRQDLTVGLDAEPIEEACRRANHPWRRRGGMPTSSRACSCVGQTASP